eukprot:SM000031S11503  [mRNA]  locus=s31:78716:80038:+ [translate_table: standard]
MELPPGDLERLMFFEQAREMCAADYRRNPKDADNLTRWGGALLELAHFRSGTDSAEMMDGAPATEHPQLRLCSPSLLPMSAGAGASAGVALGREADAGPGAGAGAGAEAVSKLEQALKVDPRKADALWCLGQTHTAQGFLLQDAGRANALFQKAATCFQGALDEDPTNEGYKKALELADKAPLLHQEMQRELSTRAQLGALAAPPAESSRAAKKKKANNGELLYDVLGWVILTAAVVAWVGLAKSAVPATPPPPGR